MASPNQEELAKWLNERWPDSIIRTWSNGRVEFALNRPDLPEEAHRIKSEDLPGIWSIEDAYFGQGGFTLEFEQ